MKVCFKCKARKSNMKFYKSKVLKDGLDTYCKDCRDKLAKEYRIKNREKVLQIYREYHATHKEEAAEQYQKWYKKNRNKKVAYCRQYYKDNIEYMRQRTKDWVKENYQWKVIANQKRRAIALQAEGEYTLEDFQKQYQIQEGRCFYCHRIEKLTMDHKIPLSRGGSNWPDNIVLACLSCNCSKNDKTTEEYLQILTKESFENDASSKRQSSRS